MGRKPKLETKISKVTEAFVAELLPLLQKQAQEEVQNIVNSHPETPTKIAPLGDCNGSYGDYNKRLFSTLSGGAEHSKVASIIAERYGFE